MVFIKLINGVDKIIETDTEIKKAGNSFNLFIIFLQKHPNICQLFDFAETQNKYYLVTEYCDGGELFDRIVAQGGFTEKDTIHVVK